MSNHQETYLRYLDRYESKVPYILRNYKRYTISELAKKLDLLDYQVVYIIRGLKLQGKIEGRKPNIQSSKLDKYKRAIRKCYNKGMKIMKLSEKFGVCQGLMSYFLESRGIQEKVCDISFAKCMDSRHPVANVYRYKRKIIDEFKKGDSFHKIARNYGIGIETMAIKLERWGVRKRKSRSSEQVRLRCDYCGRFIYRSKSRVEWAKQKLGFSNLFCSHRCCGYFVKRKGIGIFRNLG